MGEKSRLSVEINKARQEGRLEDVDALLKKLIPRGREEAEAAAAAKAAARAKSAQKQLEKKLKQPTYKVKTGDNWFKIAEKVYGDARMAMALAKVNQNVYVLHQGMVLDLPEYRPKEGELPEFRYVKPEDVQMTREEAENLWWVREEEDWAEILPEEKRQLADGLFKAIEAADPEGMWSRDPESVAELLRQYGQAQEAVGPTERGPTGGVRALLEEGYSPEEIDAIYEGHVQRRAEELASQSRSPSPRADEPLPAPFDKPFDELTDAVINRMAQRGVLSEQVEGPGDVGSEEQAFQSGPGSPIAGESLRAPFDKPLLQSKPDEVAQDDEPTPEEIEAALEARNKQLGDEIAELGVTSGTLFENLLDKFFDDLEAIRSGDFSSIKVPIEAVPELTPTPEPAETQKETTAPMELSEWIVASEDDFEDSRWETLKETMEANDVEWYIDGELNVEEISEALANEIEGNRQAIAQTLGVSVDELQEVSAGRISVWLEAADLHQQGDSFNMRLLLEKSDEEIFGVTIEANNLSLDEYAETYVQVQGSKIVFAETRLNISRGFVTLAFGFARADAEHRSPQEVFRSVFAEGILIEFDPNYDEDGREGLDQGGCINTGNGFRCDTDELVGGGDSMEFQLIAHEFAHVFENAISRNVRAGLADDDPEIDERVRLLMPRGILDSTVIKDVNGVAVAGQGLSRNEEAFVLTNGQQTPWQQHGSDAFNDADVTFEEYADIFLNWAYDSFSDNEAGDALYAWTDDLMPWWIEYATEDFDQGWMDRERQRREDLED